jgi:nucleotide-binding universal stress UspA family protein
MRILLAVDGSQQSQKTVNEFIKREWPRNSEVRVISVAHPVPFIPEPTLGGAAGHVESLKEERKRALRDVAKVAKEIAEQAPGFQLTTEVLEGSPKKEIVEEAKRWEADLIVLGSHGHGPAERFLLGSVAQSVALHAPCSVEIVRPRAA